MKFQESQGTRQAYLTTMELAYRGRGEDGPGASREQARAALINAVGWSLVLLYPLVGPSAVVILLGLLAWCLSKNFVDCDVRSCAHPISRYCRHWSSADEVHQLQGTQGTGSMGMQAGTGAWVKK